MSTPATARSASAETPEPLRGLATRAASPCLENTMVEVVIPEYRLKALDNEVLKGQVLLKELREAMVPVVGVLFPHGVAWGSLTITTAGNGDTVLRWDEE